MPDRTSASANTQKPPILYLSNAENTFQAAAIGLANLGPPLIELRQEEKPKGGTSDCEMTLIVTYILIHGEFSE